MTAKIAWSPDSTRFVARLPDRRIRLHEVDGSLLRPMGMALDVGWSSDGEHVLSIDDKATVRWHGPVGVERQQRLAHGDNADRAAFAPKVLSVAYVEQRPAQVVIATLHDKPSVIEPMKHGIRIGEITELALSPDAGHVAVGWHTRTERGIAVFDVRRDRLVVRETYEVRAAYPVVALAFAFDDAGSRLAFALADRGVLHGGIFELARGDGDRPAVHASGAHAVALDARGLIAAFARGRELVFEFLDEARAGASVRVESTLAYESNLPDLVALAFDPTSRWLACLATDGTIDVMPVP